VKIKRTCPVRQVQFQELVVKLAASSAIFKGPVWHDMARLQLLNMSEFAIIANLWAREVR
jgi:hypothetical protein